MTTTVSSGTVGVAGAPAPSASVGGGGGDYTFDAFDDGSSKLVGEKQMVKMRAFIERYSGQLRDIEEALDESLSDVWDINLDPVALTLEPYEQSNLLELCRSDNKLFNKVMLVFSSLCLEMRSLKRIAEERLYAPFLMFGELVAPVEGEAQLFIGRMLPFLQDLVLFVNRAMTVIQNVVRQLASLYTQESAVYRDSFREVHLTTVFEAISDLLIVLVTLDQAAVQSPTFRQAWNMYKRMSKSVRSEPARYGTDEDHMLRFEKLLLSIEGQLLDGLIFQSCADQEFDFPGMINVRNNAELNREFMWSLRALYLPFGEGAVEVYAGMESEEYLKLLVLSAFYYRIFRDNGDKKFFRNIWPIQKRVPLIPLRGALVLQPAEFLVRNLEPLVRALGKAADLGPYQRDIAKNLERSFPDMTQSLYLQLCVWMVRMESNLSNRAEIREIINTRIDLCIRGLTLARQIAQVYKVTINLHLTLRIPLRPADIRMLFRLIELLKAIQSTFHRRSAMIGETLTYMVQQTSYSLQRALMPIKLRVEQMRNSHAKLDLLSALGVALQMLNGPGSLERRLLLRLSLHVAFQSAVMRDVEMEDVRLHLRRLENITDIQRAIVDSCNCDFLFWNREMLPPFLAEIYKAPDQAYKLRYLFAAFRDVLPVIHRAQHVPKEQLLEALRKEIRTAFDDSIIRPLCHDIETDLRLHIHMHLKVSERNPFKNGVRDLAHFLNLLPLRFFNQTIDIKSHVVHYLDTQFYNLNTVALFDWKTYEEMRGLAKEKYGLELTEVHLPGATLEQGLDVLEIMRNIHLFVRNYSYNLNNQIFIERYHKGSDTKHLNTINVQHVANSIRTHGLGIMNTTVNFTFQFLKHKFVIFSQFLFDDHIKGRLYKDMRFFRESKEALKLRYPFERADKFNKDIRKLGVSDDGMTFLDQFRRLITEIGNAMGYIRMIRSGGHLYTSNAIKFVPDLQDIMHFEELAARDELSPETVEACRNVDGAVDNLAKAVGGGTEYFSMLVNVFAAEFRGAQNSHLKNFFMIVPPLTINFIEHMMLAKEKLAKKGATPGMLFCDDGFAIGVAYILKLLDQNRDFNTLHWFESVAAKYTADIQKLQSEKRDKKEEKQSLTLTMKKLQTYLQEFQLLQFSFSGAKIFFNT